MFRLFRIRFFSSDHLCLVGLGLVNMLFAVAASLTAVFLENYITWMLKCIFALFEWFIGFHLAAGSYNMERLSPGYWKKEFHRAVMHDDWAKIYTDASEFSKIFEKYEYFYICTDTFHDLPLQQLKRALNILAEKNPEYFTRQLIETVLSDAENGLEYAYQVHYNSEGTLEIEKWTDDQIQNVIKPMSDTIFTLDDFPCCCIGVFMHIIMVVLFALC